MVRLAHLAHSEEWTLHDVIPVQSIPASTASLLCATERYNLEIRKLALGIGIPAIPILLKTWPLWESKGEGLLHHSGLRSALHRALKQPITVLETATTNWLLDDVSSLMPVTHESAGLALRLTFASLAAWMPNPPFLRLELAALRERVCFALSSQAGAHTFDLYFPHLPLDLRELGYFCEFIVDNIASVASTLLIARSPYCGNKKFPAIFYALALWEAASTSTGIYSLPALEPATHSYEQPYHHALGSWGEFCGKLAKRKMGQLLGSGLSRRHRALRLR